MNVRRDDIRAPNQNVLCAIHGFRIRSDRGANCVAHAEHAGRRADRAIEQRRAKTMEESPVHTCALQQAHRAGVAVRQNRFGIFFCNRRQFCRDRVQGFVP